MFLALSAGLLAVYCSLGHHTSWVGAQQVGGQSVKLLMQLNTICKQAQENHGWLIQLMQQSIRLQQCPHSDTCSKMHRSGN